MARPRHRRDERRAGRPYDDTAAPGRLHASGLAGHPARQPGARPYGPGPRRSVLGEPVTEDTGRHWCQEVTVAFPNSSGTAVRSGSVTCGTHIVGALGVDWGTVESTVPLPVPLAPGARKRPAWTVCVDARRVPLGMRTGTREVSADGD
ncbi:hypothetical protein [Streptomyces achromogenes]|uniref:hypothetical protein n=1 Tax=Streptomyces achromogenes TaxID=67255 RepID=UPI003A7F87FE